VFCRASEHGNAPTSTNSSGTITLSSGPLVETGLQVQLSEALNELRAVKEDRDSLQKSRNHYKDLATKLSNDLGFLTEKTQTSLAEAYKLSDEKEKLLEEFREKEMTHVKEITRLRDELCVAFFP
jgi:predicted  nucleic acid-binding Zn-ribbon protein